MAGPCVDDSETVELTVVGAPGELHARAHDVSNDYSATQGDAVPHTVTDGGVVHTQTQTVNVPNPLTESAVRGILVAKFDPIIVTDWAADVEIVYGCELIIGGVSQDVYTNTVDLDSADTPPTLICALPVLLGQIVIAASGTTSVVFRKTVENNGLSTTWTFRMDGDKIVVQLGP